MNILPIEVNTWCKQYLLKPPVCYTEAPTNGRSKDGRAEVFALSSVPLVYILWHYQGVGRWKGCSTEPCRYHAGDRSHVLSSAELSCSVTFPGATELQCWSCSNLIRPSEKRDSLGGESIEIAPWQRFRYFGMSGELHGGTCSLIPKWV